MEHYTLNDMKRAFKAGRIFQLTGEDNFQELIDVINDQDRNLKDSEDYIHIYEEAIPWIK